MKMAQGIHLTTIGFESLLQYYASINIGVSAKVNDFFPNIVPMLRGIAILPDTLNPHWVSGFIAGDGCFNVGIRSSTGRLFYTLNVAQHIRDLALMNMLVTFFGCGKVYSRPLLNRCDFIIQTSAEIVNVVIPHFDCYPLQNVKDLDYQNFKLIMSMVADNTAQSNIQTIKALISGMNSKRAHIY